MTTSLLQKLHSEFLGDDWPEFKYAEQNNDNVKFLIKIPSSLSWFTGHFPGTPVLPGVVQIHWATRLFLFTSGHSQLPTTITNLKFKEVMLPDMTIELNIDIFADKDSATFCYRNKEQTFSSGSLKFPSTVK